jgi:hypothetical protein
LLRRTQLWGGYAKDIVGPEISDGGPGLAPMGVMKTNWFTELHENYREGVTVTLKPIPVLQGAIDPYYTYDYWVVPVSWQLNFFDTSFWNGTVRHVGESATRMGPLTYGARRFSDDPDEAQSFTLLQDPRVTQRTYVWHEPIHEGMPHHIKVALRWENLRRSHVQGIVNSTGSSRNKQPKGTNPENEKDNVINAKDEVDTEDEDGEDEIVPACPRWFEITEYLFDNRGPLELALDTMTFDMPEATLYRYIMNRGGLNITTGEWRVFLRHCNFRDDLFKYAINTLIVSIITNYDIDSESTTRRES